MRINRILVFLIPPLVWLLWFYLPDNPPFWALARHWRITPAMAFGAFIGGAAGCRGLGRPRLDCAILRLFRCVLSECTVRSVMSRRTA